MTFGSQLTTPLGFPKRTLANPIPAKDLGQDEAVSADQMPMANQFGEFTDDNLMQTPSQHFLSYQQPTIEENWGQHDFSSKQLYDVDSGRIQQTNYSSSQGHSSNNVQFSYHEGDGANFVQFYNQPNDNMHHALQPNYQYEHPSNQNIQMPEHYGEYQVMANGQEDQGQYGTNFTAEYNYVMPQNPVFRQVDGYHADPNEQENQPICVDNFIGIQNQMNKQSEYQLDYPAHQYPLQQYVNDFRPKKDSVVGPIRNKNVQTTPKSSTPVQKIFYSEEETQEILDLELMEADKIITENVSRRLLYELNVRVIPQEKFARKVLGRSQSTFSQLVHYPKNWDVLRGGRATYRKLKEWIDMTEEQKMEVLKENEADVAAAAKKHNGFKRFRTIFTQEQLDGLNAHFEQFPTDSSNKLKELADRLELPLQCVQTFFMNCRRKLKKQKYSKV